MLNTQLFFFFFSNTVVFIIFFFYFLMILNFILFLNFDAWGWCTGTTQRDGMGREEGGGFRMGNTCIPVAETVTLKGPSG